VSGVPDPRIDRPGDAIIQIVGTHICGSYLHTYEGRTDMEPGRVLGHESRGRVVEVGAPFDLVRGTQIVLALAA
jgi:threonine dehydrogenase-like Zn-dependent dehydrogenase